MIIISKVQDEDTLNWFTEQYDLEEKTETKELPENFNINENLSSEDVFCECEKIEACSKNDKIYCYNSKWDNNTVSHLKEYAFVCGLKEENFRSFDCPKIEASNNERRVEANRSIEEFTQNLENSQQDLLTLALGDPFNIERNSNTDHMKKHDWQKINKQSELKDAPMNLGIIPLRGEQEVEIPRDIKFAKNVNTILDPNKIQNLFENDKLDTGEKLKQQKEARKEDFKIDLKEREKEIVEAANKDYMKKGKVFMTQAYNTQNNLRLYSENNIKFDKKIK